MSETGRIADSGRPESVLAAGYGKDIGQKSQSEQACHESAHPARDITVGDEERNLIVAVDIAVQDRLLPPRRSIVYYTALVDEARYAGIGTACNAPARITILRWNKIYFGSFENK